MLCHRVTASSQKAFFQTIFCPLEIFQRGLVGYYCGYSDDPRRGQSGHAHHDCWMSVVVPGRGGTTPAVLGRVARFEISDYRAIKFKKLNPCPNNRNNGSKLVPLIGGAKGNGKTAKTRSPCAPNSVDICFGWVTPRGRISLCGSIPLQKNRKRRKNQRFLEISGFQLDFYEFVGVIIQFF